MCGICGIIGRGKPLAGARPAMEGMRTLLAHRGPDGEGAYHNERIELGFRRLSIIDLTGGWQPLYNEDGSVALIVNGEIYNYVALAEDLKARGHVFSTQSDCETIVHLYEEYGLDFIHHLRGMFAMALWDDRSKTCILARDRFGEKPLYYHANNDCVVFSSEIKSILCSGHVPFELDPTGINHYLHYNYIPAPFSPIKGVQGLPPAHMLRVNALDGSVTMTKYWDMADAPAADDVNEDRLLDSMRDIMSIITRSDVPVGLALSGGIDSSAIAALLAEQGVRDMHAISVGYQGCPDCDERGQARALARKYGFGFHEAEISLRELSDFFPQLVYWMDTPVADVTGSSYYTLMRKSRELEIPVLLNGHGGDEFFWGYPWVKECVALSREKQARLLAAGAKPGDMAAYVFLDISPQFDAAREALPVFFSQSFQEAVRRGPGISTLYEAPLPWSDPDIEVTKVICGTYLEGNGIAQCDRYGMASSVEARLPFLDYRYIETVISLRKASSDNLLPAKSRLKAALRGVLPDSLLDRAKKGFAPPVEQWMVHLRSVYGRFLRDGYLVRNNILDSDALEQIFEDRYIRWRGAPIFYKILVLEFWCRAMHALTLDPSGFSPAILQVPREEEVALA